MFESLPHLLAWNFFVVILMAGSITIVSLFPVMKRRPALRHALWFLVLVKLVTPPLIPVPVLAGVTAESDSTLDKPVPRVVDITEVEPASGNVNDEALPLTAQSMMDLKDSDRTSAVKVEPHEAATPPEILPRVIATAVFAWTAVALILLTRGFLRVRRLSLLIQRADEANDRLKRIARVAGQRMGVADFDVREIDGQIPPMVWARWSRPVILFPRELIGQMSDDQLLWAVGHELAHFRRRDQWSNSFAMLVTALCWWHPAAWVARNEMRKAQELCADEAVIRACDVSVRSYMKTLLQALEFIQLDEIPSAAPASCLFDSSALESRFQILAGGNLVHRTSWRIKAILLLGLAGLMCLPVNAQTGDNSQSTVGETTAKGLPAGNDRGSLAAVAPGTDDSQAGKQLFMHWYSGTAGDRPRMILTSRVTPSKNMDIALTDSDSGRSTWINGQITSNDRRTFDVRMNSLWKSHEQFGGTLKLDEPLDATGFLWNNGYFPTHIVLSHKPSIEGSLKPPTRGQGDFGTDTTPLRFAAVRPSNYANELARTGGNSIGNWLVSNVYKPSLGDEKSDRYRILAKQSLAKMFSRDTKPIQWNLTVIADEKELVPIVERKARFVMDLGDGNKWDEEVLLKYFLQGPPRIRRFDIRDSVSPARSWLHVEFSISHPDGRKRATMTAWWHVRSAYYGRYLLPSGETWQSAFDLIKSEQIDFAEAAADGAKE